MLDIKVSAALLGYTQEEQRIILSCFREQKEAPTARLRKGVDLVANVYENHVEVVEGYAGFPIDKALIDKNKQAFKDDRNIGRVVTQGGNSMVITGKKSDGRYSVVGKKGEKTAKKPEDLGLNFQREHIDIEDLHQMMVEGLKQARKNVGMDPNKPSCWKGYKATGTKMKGGKEVPDCKKEEVELEEGVRSALKRVFGKKEAPAEKKPESRGEQLRKKYNVGPEKSDTSAKRQILNRSRARAERDEAKYGGSVYTKKVADKSKEAHDRYLKAGYSKYGAGDARGKGNKAHKRAAALQKEDYENMLFLEQFIDFNDPELDTLTFEELEEICTEALLELDEEMLTEALEFIDGMDLLTEVMDRKEIQRRRDQAKDRLATSSAMKSAASKPAPKQRDAGAEARQRLTSKSSSDASPAAGARREKVKAALKTAGSAIKKGLSATKSAAKKAVGGASEVAGAAAGGFRKGYSDARGKSEPKRSDSGSHSSERVSGSSSSGSSSSSTSGGEGRVRLRDRLKSGIKKAIGSAARVVSRKARSVARRLGEEQQLYSWREEMGVGE